MFESKTFRVWFGAILLIAAMSCGRALSAQEKPQRVAPADYRIRVGDVLEVSVYQHPEFSSRVVVMGDGNHALTVSGVKVSDLSAMDGMLHDLKVVDLSALDVGVLLHAKLESVIPEPQVTVMVAPFMQPLPPSARPSPQLQDTPSAPPLPTKTVLPSSHRLRDVPSPESLQNCCVS